MRANDYNDDSENLVPPFILFSGKTHFEYRAPLAPNASL
jgi:hypothetical protein